MPKATRSEVYAAIDSERKYQDWLWPNTEYASAGESNPLTIGEFILLLEEYTARARFLWSQENKPEEKALHAIRKIVGIGVNCMEQHGAPKR